MQSVKNMIFEKNGKDLDIRQHPDLVSFVFPSLLFWNDREH